MLTLSKQSVSIYVDKTRQQWIVRDPDGNFWIVPSIEKPWDHRQPFDPSGEEVDLELVPGHYGYMLDLPF
jgi:hypothetical protein